MDSKRSFKDTLVRAVALIGLLLVLMLGAWGILLLAFNLPLIASNVGTSVVSLFNVGSSPASTLGTITVTAPQSVNSGSSFSLSWTAENADSSYNYTVSYDCSNGLSIKAPTPSGSYQNVPCATPFNYVSATEKMTLIPSITGSSAVPASITVSATKDGQTAIVASGTTIVSVTPATTVSTNTNTGSTATTQPGTTYVPATHTTNLYGYADLAVQILSVTPTSQYSGQYYGQQSPRVNVQFEIVNQGTNIAPAGWMFTANLPVGYSYLYSSPTQQALYPGDKIVYTLGFNSASSNSNQYCNQQSPNQTCPWYQQPYQTYPYQGTCYQYNGYQNIPMPCMDSEGNPVYVNQNYNTTYNNGSNYGYTYNGNLITITADAQNYIYDLNRANNTASIASPIY